MFNKIKNSPFRSLWWVVSLQLKQSRLFLVWSIFNSVFSGISSVVLVYLGAKFLASVTAIVFTARVESQVYVWLALILVLETTTAVVSTINSIIERRMQQKMDITLNTILVNKMYELSQEQFDDEQFNTKFSRASDSLSSMWRLTTETSWLMSSLVTFTSSIVAIIFVSPMVGIAISILVIPATLLRIKQNNENERISKLVEPAERIARRSRWLLIDPNTMPEIRLMNAFKHMLSSWSVNLTKSQDIIFESDKRMAPIDIGSQVIQPLLSFGATLYFLKLLIARSIGLDRFIFLRGLLGQASYAATSIVMSFQQLHETSIGMKNFNDVFNTGSTLPNGKVKVTSPLTIEFKNVGFAYPHSDNPALNNISFIIVPGSRLALVGENGAGKSTLLKLLLRQYLPSSGQILINGVDIRDVEQTSYYSAISNLSQTFMLINHLTIKDNLQMGIDRHLSHEDMDRVAELVGAQGFINHLPHKYMQRLDPSFDDGTGLSGGQTQRIGVMRSLLREGDILVLDEPTSAIDAKAEYKIFNN
ncbi:MAG: ABC transporter ATP-binding protein, partial [Candidatus Saccharimonadales bacterium]